MDFRLETNLATRVSAAISAEPALEGNAVATTATRRPGSLRWWQPVVGGSIAAAVAIFSVLWVRSQAPIGSDAIVAENLPAPTTVVSQSDTADTASGAPEGYVVPQNVEPRTIIMPPAELANYMVAHSEYSTPVTRRFPLSTLVGTQGNAGESDDAADEAVPVEDPAENAEKTK